MNDPMEQIRQSRSPVLNIAKRHRSKEACGRVVCTPPRRSRQAREIEPRSRSRSCSRGRCSGHRTRNVSRERHRTSRPATRNRSRTRGGYMDTADIHSELISKFTDIIQSINGSHSKEHFANSNVVPEFDPSQKNQTISNWLTKVNECAILYGWSDRQIIHYALPKLSGVAKKWYEGLPTVLFTWAEWQTKLLNAFPSDENYGQMLSDMLEKKAKFGDSLEDYFYDKVALINRCDIKGKRAVECVLHGIEDRSIRLGAEAAQFDNPDKLLAYLRNVSTRKFDKSVKKDSKDIKTNTYSNKTSIKCYNCKEEGHPASKCQKPLKKCIKCSMLGHLDSECFSNKKNEQKRKVLLINKDFRSNELDKYVQDIYINSIRKVGFIDLGSDLTLIRESDAKEIFKQWDSTDNRPMVGFGGTVIHSLGSGIANVSIQGVNAKLHP
ncbi:uncharacterized protein LOC113404385 [Vanessa tameamea]|uniref:Uncharacterized protein LOC113404385 n=1 Tax=Vanessa tameamea TaxID=334116 RepID=A0ABM4AN70_VANTA